MKKIAWKNPLLGCFVAGLVVGGMICAILGEKSQDLPKSAVFESKFGSWLAVQHAIFIDDFEKAVEFLDHLSDVKVESVRAARNLVLFLDRGVMPDEKGGDSRLEKGGRAVFWIINNAVLVRDGKWKTVYANFKNEKSQMLAPFRIWSSVESGNFARAVEFIDSNPMTTASWKDFQKGMIYAATKNPKTARRHFQKVQPAFMNLGDYHFVMSFYDAHGFKDDAKALREKWIQSPGGMFMADLDLGEDWTSYNSSAKMMAFGLIQNISHSGEGSVSDSGLLVLRVAAFLGARSDSVDYYTGRYFFSNGSDNYKKYWTPLESNPIFGPFVKMKIIETLDGSRARRRQLNDIVESAPMFMPAIQELWRENIQNNRQYQAISVLNRALRQPNLPDSGRAYILELRARTGYLFGDFETAANDVKLAAKLAPMDARILRLSARIWAAEKSNLDEAYRYAISLIKAFPADVENWNVLAQVVYVREGLEPALEILERIGRVATTCSELFMWLGDLRSEIGLKSEAIEAYKKAISLSDDGLVLKKTVERKLKKVEK